MDLGVTVRVHCQFAHYVTFVVYLKAMRLLTWNLERSTPRVQQAQLDLLATLKSDIEDLTEPGRVSAFEGSDCSVVFSDPHRDNGESWVLIRGHPVRECEFDIPYDRMAAAATARVGYTDLLIYGSVLPWRAGPSQASDIFDLPAKGVPSAAVYGAWLTAQLRDIEKLTKRYPKHHLIWMGDFNVTVQPPHKYHLAAGSKMVIEAMRALGLRVVNANSPHHNPQLHTIDLICVPLSFAKVVSDHRGNGKGDPKLSDHLLYYVDIEAPSQDEG